MITDDHRARLPGPGWKLHLSPEQKQVIVTAPDGTKQLFDTPEEAIAWAHDPAAVALKRRLDAEGLARVVQQKREREPVNRAIAAPGWTVRYRRATDDWEASRGAQREYFATEEEAITFTHES